MAPRSRITRSSSATPAKRKPTRETITISDSESDEIQAPAPKRVKGKGKAVPAVIYDEELSVEDVTDPRTTLACHRSLFLGPTVCPCSLSLSPATPATPFSFDDKETDFLAKSIVQCDSKCQKFVCRGCAAYIEHFDAGKCCAEGRAIVIFEVLAALDTLYLVDGRLSKKDDTPGVVSKGRKTAKPKGLGGGTGYGTSSVHGAAHPMMTQAMFDAMEGAYDDEDDEGEFGDFDDFDEYEEAMMMEEAGYHRGLAPAAAPFISKDADKHKEQDRLITIALNLLANLLPHPDSPDALGLDFMPSATLTPLLLLSTLPEILSDLCRNDSVTDWAQRSDLYFAMLRVLAAICEEAGTVAVFFGERRGLLWSEGIGKWMAGEGEIEWTREAAPVVKTTKRKAKGPPPTSARPVLPVLLVTPLFSLFSSLIQQATAFRKLAGSSDGAFGAEDSALLGICGDICDTGEKCKRTLAVWEQIQERERVVVVENGKGKEVSADDYASFCRLHSYSQDVSLSATTDDKITWPTHKYAKEITSIAQSRRGNVAFVHLVKELAVLSTSLPSGIFVRVDESRIDVIKCLIAGPVDTPYAGGLFEFDIFIPLQYPQVPPLVSLKTTGSGRVRFNPNLYADGKTCLSLIGTWPGRPEEMWQAKSSTILQVLLSVQSMILGTAFPFFNEPGFGEAKDNQNSKNYNKNVSLATVRYAMLEWMTPETKSSIWADVIAGHFTRLGDEILKTTKGWAKKDDRMSKWSVGYDGLAGSHAAATAPKVTNATTRNLVAELETALEEVATWKPAEELS